MLQDSAARDTGAAPLDSAITPSQMAAALEERSIEAARARNAADAATRRMTLLAKASERLASSLDYETTLRQITEMAVPAVADWALYTVDAGDGTIRIVASHHVDPAKQAFIDETARRYPISADEPAGAARVIRTGEAELIPDIPDAVLEAVARDAEHLELLRAVGFRSLMTVPLIAQGRVLGALGFVTGESGRLYSADDLAFAQELARRAATALDHARLFAEASAARQDMERHLAASELARSDAEAARARSDAVLASIADAFYLLDRDWRFIYVNDAAEPLLQTTRDQLLGCTLWNAFPGVLGSPFEGPYRDAMANGRVTSAEAYFEPLATWFDVRTYPWAGGLMVHFRDIGARKEAEAERERLLADAEAARQEAETANRAKSEFLAVMSHELRTPLNAIGGYAELMELGIQGPVTDAQRAVLARIQQSQRHLLGLINEVLNYARLETGSVQYQITDVALQEVVAEAEALVAPQARAKGLLLSMHHCACQRPARADAEKLRQILVNLLSNAVKFTDARDGQPGRITLSCASESDRAVVRVRDSGIGIPLEKQDAIFEPFVQVRADLTRTAEGTGLGLAISRDLARGMGGELTVESTVGRGSVFTLTLPS